MMDACAGFGRKRPGPAFMTCGLQAVFTPMLSGFLVDGQDMQSWFPGLLLSANCSNLLKTV